MPSFLISEFIAYLDFEPYFVKEMGQVLQTSQKNLWSNLILREVSQTS